MQDDLTDRATPSRNVGRAHRIFVIIVAAVVGLDQVTKVWAARRLPGDPIRLLGSWLELEYAENTGAAFSMLQGRGAFLGVAAVAAVMIIAAAVTRLDRTSEVVAVSLIAGGAIGNLLDRMTRGEGFLDGFVVDFVRLWWIPNFNVADSAITIGAATMVALALFVPQERT